MQSIFSKIIKKEISCHLVAENDCAIAFMDIQPIALGHVLVVPKVEQDYLFDLDDDIYSQLWGFTKTIQYAIKQVVKCKKIGVSVVGLEVPHAHIHLIPINSIDDMNFKNKISISNADLRVLASKIAQHIKI